MVVVVVVVAIPPDGLTWSIVPTETKMAEPVATAVEVTVSPIVTPDTLIATSCTTWQVLLARVDWEGMAGKRDPKRQPAADERPEPASSATFPQETVVQERTRGLTAFREALFGLAVAVPIDWLSVEAVALVVVCRELRAWMRMGSEIHAFPVAPCAVRWRRVWELPPREQTCPRRQIRRSFSFLAWESPERRTSSLQTS